MKSKVFSIDIIRKPNYQQIWIYRTNGLSNGGGLRMYSLTLDRLVRVLRAMVNTSAKIRCNTYTGKNTESWYISGVVEEMQAARAALAGS